MAEKWRGQETTVSIVDQESDSSIPVGVLQDCEFSVNREVSELYGAGSIKRQDEQATELSISVSATFGAFDAQAFEDLANITTSGITDSPDLPKFEITGTFTSSSGTSQSYTVSGVYFEEVPIGGSRDEWIELSLEGSGNDLIKG